MFRICLILMLAAMQLLALNSKPLYLCVNASGDACCLEFGPEYCHCCRHFESEVQEISEPESCEATVSHCEAGCCRHHDEQPKRVSNRHPDSLVVATTRDCDCEHRLVSSGQAYSVSRTSEPTKVIDGLQFTVAPAVEFELSVLALVQSRMLAQVRPPGCDDAQLLLSTVALRC